MLKVDTLKLINSIKAKENNIGLLRGYRVSIHLNEKPSPQICGIKKVASSYPTYSSG